MAQFTDKERKFHGGFCSLERKFQGTKVRENESSHGANVVCLELVRGNKKSIVLGDNKIKEA